jgi:peptide/nickel transport system substrate-binding protein
MKRAQTLQLTNPRGADALWAQIDHQLADSAPWIPYFTPKETDFVSKRVGNVQFHPQWLLLFDQLWVR